MNIALIGYGKMGREVELVASERGHSVVHCVDPVHAGGRSSTANPALNLALSGSLSSEILADVDGVIEFAQPEGISERVGLAMRAGKAYILGTTGIGDRLEGLKALAVAGADSSAANSTSGTVSGALLYGSNFSIGAHLFFRIVKQAAGLINAFPEYDIMLSEHHHSQKKDSPSGTAISIAQEILAANKQKTHITTEVLQRSIEPKELHVSSTRGGKIPGIHQVRIDSAADSIVLEHSARNRAGFALGAVRALEWLMGKQGFFTAEDFFADALSS